MRTVDYSDILRGSAALAGFTPDDLGVPEFSLFREFHDARLQLAWEIHRWPEICPIEQRQFRVSFDYSGATYYAAGAEVLDIPSQSYFQSLVANNNQAPTVNGVENSAYWAACKPFYQANPWASGAAYAVGDQVQDLVSRNLFQCISAHTAGGTFAGEANLWGKLTPFLRTVAYVQSWEANAIGEVLGAWDKDPRLTTIKVKLHPQLDAYGINFVQLRPVWSFVWLWYRLRRPVLSGAYFDPAAVYAAGQQIYYVTLNGTGPGNFYTAALTTTAGDTPESRPAAWTVVPIPYYFRSYLIRAGYIDWLTADGQGEKAGQMEPLAEALLEREVDKLTRQQQQVWRFDFK